MRRHWMRVVDEARARRKLRILAKEQLAKEAEARQLGVHALAGVVQNPVGDVGHVVAGVYATTAGGRAGHLTAPIPVVGRIKN